MTVEVFAIRLHLNSSGRDRYAYVSSITKRKDSQAIDINVSHNSDETDKFEDPEIQDKSLMFFSRRQALVVRDYVANKIANSYKQVNVDVVPQQIGLDVASRIIMQPPIDMSL